MMISLLYRAKQQLPFSEYQKILKAYLSIQEKKDTRRTFLKKLADKLYSPQEKLVNDLNRQMSPKWKKWREGLEDEPKLAYRNNAPRELIKFSFETSDQWINRCYDHDPRCDGEDLTEYPVLDKGWWVYPYFKVAASEEEIQQHNNLQVNTPARKSSSIGNDTGTDLKVNTHKAYCPVCQKDNFIDWYSYPDEKHKKLGCTKCQTRIDVYKAYRVKKQLGNKHQSVYKPRRAVSEPKSTETVNNRDYVPLEPYRSSQVRICPICGHRDSFTICSKCWFRSGRFVPANKTIK